MGEKAGASIIGWIFSAAKGGGSFFLKFLYLLPLIVFGLWLISHVYISGFDLSEFSSVGSENQDDTMSKMILQQNDMVPRDHFHMTDTYIEEKSPNLPVCADCHGTYAHGKEKKLRAIYNMHAGYLACTVCHVRKDGGDAEGGALLKNEKVAFLWMDRETGDFKTSVNGAYGKYTAMIYPTILSAQGKRRIVTPIEPEAAQEFLRMWPERTPDEFDAARKKLHETISKEAVSCSDCHKKDGYLDFLKLGFPKQRVDDLVSNEFVGMIDKYQTFYLPSVIDFNGE